MSIERKNQKSWHSGDKVDSWRRSSSWERSRARKGDDKGWDGWIVSSTPRTWVWALWEIVKDRETWRAAVYGIAKSRKQLSTWTTTYPKTNSEDSPQLWQFLKGKIGEECQWFTEAGSWVLHHSPRCADQLILSSDVTLPAWSACRIVKGAIGSRGIVI